MEKQKEKQKRTTRIVSRFSPDELSLIDARRGRLRRGAFLRIAALGKVPRHIPQINAATAADLARALGNLSTVATAMRSGEYIEIESVRQAVREVAQKLRGIRLEDGDEEPGEAQALSVAINGGVKLI